MFTLALVALIIIIVFFSGKHQENYSENRSCFDPKMTDDELQTFKELIQIVTSLLNEHKIDWIPTGGNLLAVYRHNSLFIPWDDDFDITIKDEQTNEAIHLLKENLQKYNCKLTYMGTWMYGGEYYKIHFDNNENVIKRKHEKLGNIQFSWPFVDLFINATMNKYDWRSAHNIQENEYPLITKNIDGIALKVPSKGSRSFEAFEKTGVLDVCQAQLYDHKVGQYKKCKGHQAMLCKYVF